jgi:hypothetical protein
MAQVITTPEQREMVEKLIQLCTIRSNEDKEFLELLKVYENTLQTSNFDGNIFDTIEEEYEHSMSIQ